LTRKQKGRLEGRPLIAAEWTELTVVGIVDASKGAKVRNLRRSRCCCQLPTVEQLPAGGIRLPTILIVPLIGRTFSELTAVPDSPRNQARHQGGACSS